jgi:hypothetical protein
MGYSFSGGLLETTVVLMLMVTLPLKGAAHLAGAKHTGVVRCALAALAGLIAGYLASTLFGGAIGGPLAAALGFALAIRFMLGTSFVSAVGLMVVAMGFSLLGLWLLAKVGVISSMPSGSEVT